MSRNYPKDTCDMYVLVVLPSSGCMVEHIIPTDGTDFRIFELTEFDPKWFSHKFRGPGVHYEIGVAFQRNGEYC
jgi:hypothetical protein